MRVYVRSGAMSCVLLISYCVVDEDSGLELEAGGGIRLVAPKFPKFWIFGDRSKVNRY